MVRNYKFFIVSSSCFSSPSLLQAGLILHFFPLNFSIFTKTPSIYSLLAHLCIFFHHSQPARHRIAHRIIPISYHRHQTFKHGSYQRRHLSPAQPTWLECLQSSRGEHSSLQSTLRCRKRDFSQVTSYGVIWKQQQQHHHQRHSTTFSNTSDYRRQRRPRS